MDADTFFQTELPALQRWRFGLEEARRITQPVLAVRGADSDAVAPVFGEGITQLRGWMPQAEALVVPDATHGMPFMNPRDLAEGLAAFFARHALWSRTRGQGDAVAHQREAPSRETSPVVSHVQAPTVKLVALYGPPTDTAAFERYYADTHVPLANQMPGLLRVETAQLLGTAQGGAAPYHRIAELWFADAEQLQAAAASPQGEALAADVANFATGGVTVLIAQVDQAGAAMGVGPATT
jgi:uncharacterized protein (TIGR02118 family)